MHVESFIELLIKGGSQADVKTDSKRIEAPDLCLQIGKLNEGAPGGSPKFSAVWAGVIWVFIEQLCVYM